MRIQECDIRSTLIGTTKVDVRYTQHQCHFMIIRAVMVLFQDIMPLAPLCRTGPNVWQNHNSFVTDKIVVTIARRLKPCAIH